MTSVDTANTKQNCVACLECIRSGATVCRHYGSRQARDLWHKLTISLKSVGGVVTVISLLIGVITLSAYYRDWRERRHAVNELTAAAQWLVKTEYYLQARQMYDEALTLAPASAKARAGQFQLAHLWLRNLHVTKDTADETLSRVTAVLYRALPNADDEAQHLPRQ